MQYLKINPELINNPMIGMMPNKQFKQFFIEIWQGKTNQLSQYIHIGYDRLPWKEWNIKRQLVFKRDNYTCQYCGKKTHLLECDHKIPLSEGGTNELSNLITACRTCNRAKSNKIDKEWRNDVV